MTKIAADYVVDYRTGGALACKWHRLLGRFTLADAIAMRDALVRLGYAALAMRAQSAETLGLPVGWTASAVDWERDTIVYGKHETLWLSHKLTAAD